MALSQSEFQALSESLQESFGGPEAEQAEVENQPEAVAEPEPEAVEEAAEQPVEEPKTEDEPKRAGEKRLAEELKEREQRLDRYKVIGEDDWSIETSAQFLNWAKSENVTAEGLVGLLEKQLGPGVVDTLEQQLIEPRVAELRDTLRAEVEDEILQKYLGTTVPPTRKELERIQRDLKDGRYLEEEVEEDQAVVRARKKEAELDQQKQKAADEQAKAQAEAEAAKEQERYEATRKIAEGYFERVQADAVADLEKLGFEISEKDSPAEQRRKFTAARQIIENAWATLNETDPEAAQALRTIDANLKNGKYGLNETYFPGLKRKLRAAAQEEFRATQARFGGGQGKNSSGRIEPKANGASRAGGRFDPKELETFLAANYGGRRS